MEALRIWVRSMETKKDIRKQALARRSRLTPREVEEKSRMAGERVCGHPWFQKASVLLVYLSIRQEVRTREIIEAAWTAGKQVFAPAVEGREMEFWRMDSFDALKKGTWDIPEPPRNEKLSLADMAPEDVLVLMPGAAFDRHGGRAGYGGGYYDRYFSRWPKVHKMALAYDCQLTERVPVEEFDISPDVIVTEWEIIEL
mgnify:CR=1 FL=1